MYWGWAQGSRYIGLAVCVAVHETRSYRCAGAPVEQLTSHNPRDGPAHPNILRGARRPTPRNGHFTIRPWWQRRSAGCWHHLWAGEDRTIRAWLKPGTRSTVWR